MRAPVLKRLGIIHHEQGDYAAAHAYLRQSLAISEEMGDMVRSSSVLTHLGQLAMAQGNDREAEEFLAKALLLICQTGHLHDRIAPLNTLGRLAQRQGDYGRARTLHAESLALCIELGHKARLARTLEALACLAVRQGQAAARLFGATALYAVPTLAQFDPSWRQEHDQLVALAHTQLGEAAFAAAWAAGAAMTLEEAVALIETPAQI
jgi:uncharacterized protein HemY